MCFLVWFWFFFFLRWKKVRLFFIRLSRRSISLFICCKCCCCVSSLVCVCPPTQVRICKVYMLVHYCGDPGACNNNEAKNLPSPLSSHPLYPKLRGMAAVWRGCCSFFSSSRSHVPCIFLFTLPFGSSGRAHSAQTLSRPSSIPQSGRVRKLPGTRTSPFPFFYSFSHCMKKY